MRRRELAIDSRLAAQILSEARHFAPLETGGVLLGDLEAGVIAPTVTELIGAGPGARRERHRFTPDGPWQRRQIAERYAASGRTLAYLGDWHSHPTGNGPSKLDRRTAKRIAVKAAARCPHPIFLIATRAERDWELRAYRFGRRWLRRIRIAVSRPSS